MHRVQAVDALGGHAKLKGTRYSTGYRGSPKQAICPFCFKIFYDKSTMNRHVSKRVCLGLQFQVNFPADATDSSLSDHQSSVSAYNDDTVSLDPANMDAPEIIEETTLEMPEELSVAKSGKTPCPYCNKLFKGDRGVRKHIDFYGCPMALGSRFQNEH